MNIISKLHVLKYSALIAREKFRESLWRKTFRSIENRIMNTDNPKRLMQPTIFSASTGKNFKIPELIYSGS